MISGAGAKHTHARKGKKSLFADATGYVTADVRCKQYKVRLTYYAYGDTGMHKAFEYVQPYTSVKFHEDSVLAAITTDSLEVQVHPAYDKVGKLHRVIFGEGFRRMGCAYNDCR